MNPENSIIPKNLTRENVQPIKTNMKMKNVIITSFILALVLSSCADKNQAPTAPPPRQHRNHGRSCYSRRYPRAPVTLEVRAERRFPASSSTA